MTAHLNNSKLFGFVFVPTVLGAIVLLVLGAWPGLITTTLFSFLIALFSLFGFGFWFLLLLFLGVMDVLKGRHQSTQPRWGMCSAAIMLSLLALLAFDVPQRLVFAFSKSSLEDLADAALIDHVAKARGPVVAGAYHVDTYVVDERGGVYFRTCVGNDMIDTLSFGFAFHPNQDGTPFGNAHYELRHLSGEWYAFSVSDDW